MTSLHDLEVLASQLKSLPGVTTKQAEKIAQYLLRSEEDKIEELIQQIKNVRNNIKFCSQCNTICLSELCNICANNERLQNQLCIVTTPNDLDKIENTHTFFGLYFVLHDEINVRSKTPLDKEITKKLIKLLKTKDFKEIIIATNWTPNGEATAYFIKQIINEMFPNIKIFRLAVGLPINSALNYADNETLTQALKNKTIY